MSYQYAHSHLDCPTCVKVGNEINRLREENARIKAEIYSLVAENARLWDVAGTAHAKLARVVEALEYEEGLDGVTPEYPCHYCGEEPHSRDCRVTVRRAALAAAKGE